MREIVRSSTRRLGPLFVAVAMVLALAGTALAGSGPQPEPIEPSEPPPWELADVDGDQFVEDLWFVELSEEPRTRGGTPAAHASERAQLEAQARAQGVAIDQRRDFDTLWNGMTVRADVEEIAAIRALPTVTAVYPVAIIEAPEPESVSPQLSTALEMTGASTAQGMDLTGEGLSVGVIDTGIDYNHPDLGGSGDPEQVILADEDTREFDHPRISHAWDYVGEGFDASDPDSPDPDPNPDPWDPHGHGTHVSGIVGASPGADSETEITGVAPEVTFGAYKVFDAGSTTADIIVEALEDALEDGMDIVNMSLGATLVWGQEYPTTATSNELAAQGVVVVNSAGNDGGLGTWSLSAPANAHDIISVASADNTFFDAMVFEVAQLDDPVGFMEMEGAELPPTDGESEEVVWLGRACVDTEGDELLDDPAGKVALIARGDCTFAEKYLAAANAGATGVVIHNNVAGMFSGTIGDAGVEDVWGAGISLADGLALRGLIEDPDEAVVLEFTDEQATLPNPQGGLVSAFSSYGQDVELAFGPSVMAPGGLITATWPLDKGGYATLSGTSMSAPHVAGSVALLLEAEPELDPFGVRDRLQNTAEPALWSLAPGLGFLDHTFRQGAGMIQIDRAITAGQHVSPGQMAVGDGAEPVPFTLSVTNTTDVPVTYEVGHDPTLATGWSTFSPGFVAGFDEDAEEFFLFPASIDAPEEIEVPAGGTVDVAVTIEPPFGSFLAVPNHQYGGYLTLTPTGETEATPLQVPYSGFDGDYQSMPLLGYIDDATGQIVDVDPRLSKIRRGQLEPITGRHAFDPRRGDYPVIEALFGHYPREMLVTAHNKDTGDEFLVMQEDYLPRSVAPDHFWAFVWPGTTIEGEQVPPGGYTLQVEVLGPLGDRENLDHWETWTSPEFQIAGAPRTGPPAEPGPPPGRGPS